MCIRSLRFVPRPHGESRKNADFFQVPGSKARVCKENVIYWYRAYQSLVLLGAARMLYLPNMSFVFLVQKFRYVCISHY